MENENQEIQEIDLLKEQIDKLNETISTLQQQNETLTQANKTLEIDINNLRQNQENPLTKGVELPDYDADKDFVDLMNKMFKEN